MKKIITNSELATLVEQVMALWPILMQGFINSEKNKLQEVRDFVNEDKLPSYSTNAIKSFLTRQTAFEAGVSTKVKGTKKYASELTLNDDYINALTLGELPIEVAEYVYSEFKSRIRAKLKDGAMQLLNEGVLPTFLNAVLNLNYVTIPNIEDNFDSKLIWRSILLDKKFLLSVNSFVDLACISNSFLFQKKVNYDYEQLFDLAYLAGELDGYELAFQTDEISTRLWGKLNRTKLVLELDYNDLVVNIPKYILPAFSGQDRLKLLVSQNSFLSKAYKVYSSEFKVTNAPSMILKGLEETTDSWSRFLYFNKHKSHFKPLFRELLAEGFSGGILSEQNITLFFCVQPIEELKQMFNSFNPLDDLERFRNVLSLEISSYFDYLVGDKFLWEKETYINFFMEKLNEAAKKEGVEQRFENVSMVNNNIDLVMSLRLTTMKLLTDEFTKPIHKTAA